MGFFGSRPQGGIASDRQVVFNNAGRLGGAPDLLFDRISKTLTVENCEVRGAFIAKGGLTASINPPPVDGGPNPGEMALWFDPINKLMYVLARDAAGNATLFQLARLDDPRFTDARAPLAHTHTGSDISSAVANANVAPWSGITGKPTAYPPTGHTHSGSEITTQVASAGSAATVPWSGVTGVPAQFPPVPHGHTGADISANSISFLKLQVDSSVIANSGGAQSLNDGAGFQAGCYLFRIESQSGQAAVFVAAIGLSNGVFTWASGVNSNCIITPTIGPSSIAIQISGLGDGREYALLFDTGSAVTTFRVASGNTSGNTTVSYRRLI